MVEEEYLIIYAGGIVLREIKRDVYMWSINEMYAV